MANLKPPSDSKKEQPNSLKVVEQAKPKAPTEQTPPNAIKPLQLKIPESNKNEFKAYAAMRGKAMNDLFLDMFEYYKQHN